MHPERPPAGSLRLRDAETGRSVALPGSRARLVRVLVAVEADGSLAMVRAALAADLIRRVIELRGGQAQVAATAPLPDLLPYNIHPAGAVPLAAADVVVGRPAAGSVSVRIGRVEAASADGVPPLVARMLLLDHPHADAAVLEPEGVASAERRLQRWRDLVAEWAGFASAAMPEAYSVALVGRAEDDLDVRGVLALLDRLADDDDVPPGGRFELFVYADRLLGLDLAARLSS